MSEPTLTLSPSNPTPRPLKKKRVLLVDTSRTKRDLRSETMRRLGAEVDCAADISEARCWWRADLYDLVLINVDDATATRDKFCEDIRSATPSQQIMFLVGKPEYLAASPNLDQPSSAQEEDTEPSLRNDVKTALSADVSGGLPQRWGILEACRRISAVRSVSDARARAMRERPAPRRDSEMRPSKRTTESRNLDDLLREEMQ